MQAAIKVGRKECKCSFDMNEQDGSCMKSKGSCDKKCSGVATGVELMEGMYVLDMKVKKGKVTITKCEVDTPGRIPIIKKSIYQLCVKKLEQDLEQDLKQDLELFLELDLEKEAWKGLGQDVLVLEREDKDQAQTHQQDQDQGRLQFPLQDQVQGQLLFHQQDQVQDQ